MHKYFTLCYLFQFGEKKYVVSSTCLEIQDKYICELMTSILSQIVVILLTVMLDQISGNHFCQIINILRYGRQGRCPYDCSQVLSGIFLNLLEFVNCGKTRRNMIDPPHILEGNIQFAKKIE